MALSQPRRVLAFDCSGAACSAAVVADGMLLAERFVAMERGHAAALLPQIRDVMTEAGLGFDALDVLATTNGPGSFTGIRIGLAAARGLALASGKPIVSATAFEAYAAAVDVREHPSIVVAIDSKRGPLFVQRFEHGLPSGAAMSIEPEALASWLPRGRVLVIGSGVAALETDRSDVTLNPAVALRAAAVALAVARGALAGGSGAPLPLYMRPPDVSLPKAASP